MVPPFSPLLGVRTGTEMAFPAPYGFALVGDDGDQARVADEAFLLPADPDHICPARSAAIVFYVFIGVIFHCEFSPA